MSSAPGGKGQMGQPKVQGPPYAPHSQSLGGLPDKIPDIPATAVFLALYVILAVTHQKIFLRNRARGHKFVFNGALFGFCAIRIVTMSLRIAWACHPRNIKLGIAAQVFVYVGTIILYIVNWFFTQRIVRAQHPHFGWSKLYRVVHRAAIVFTILSLILLVIGAIQQFFTLNENTLRIDGALQRTGQTYFAVFCFAPIIVIIISLIVPRRRVEKFGSGRLRNNISIVLAAAVVLSIGQIFRCASAYLPATPLRNAEGRPTPTRWYYSRAAFYTFNFTTEILIVIAFAVMRVDLRFHVPDGSKKPGDYQNQRQSKRKIDVVGDEKKLKRRSQTAGSIRSTHSNETLQEYEGSLFEDSQTLADSLRYPSTILEVDPKSGHWKIKRISQATSMYSLEHNSTRNSIWASAGAEAVPPVPQSDWPLRESQMPRGQIPVMEHQNHTNESPIAGQYSGRERDIEKGDALHQAMRNLEANSEIATLPPTYDFSMSRKSRSISPKRDRHSYNRVSTATVAKRYTYTAPATNPSEQMAKKHDYSNDSVVQSPTSGTSSKVEYMRFKSASESSKFNTSSSETRSKSSMDIEAAAAEEFARFSYEASPRTESFRGSEKDGRFDRRLG